MMIPILIHMQAKEEFAKASMIAHQSIRDKFESFDFVRINPLMGAT